MNARPLRYTIDSAWDAWHESEESTARDWLVVHYASLVKFVAGRLAAGLPRTVDTGDLVSAGVFGLMNAIDRFDPSQGAKFETYAIPRIRGAILDGLRALDWVPRSVRSRSRSVQDAIALLEHQHGRTPTDEEISAELSITTDELEKWLGLFREAIGECSVYGGPDASAGIDVRLCLRSVKDRRTVRFMVTELDVEKVIFAKGVFELSRSPV